MRPPRESAHRGESRPANRFCNCRLDNRAESDQTSAMREPRPIKVSFSFYPTDTAILEKRVAELTKAGVKVRSATVLRALIHITEPAEMVARVVRMAGDSALGASVAKPEIVSDHPTVDLPQDEVRKLDAVIAQLARAKIVATRAYVVRAMLRATPAGKTLAPAVAKFLEDFPNKPRGLSEIRLARIARRRG